MESSALEREAIIAYMRAEASDETVTHAEKLATERVWGEDHCVWDVHTDRDRWWVITGLTNLYRQEDFKSMDGVLSFHLGLNARIAARQSREAPADVNHPLEKTFRQWQQSAEAQNDADEAEEFQAVGLQCRETLISFAHAMSDDARLAGVEKRPPLSDFIHWAEHVADAVVPGARNRKIRSYLKSNAKDTWEYVSWLTHEKNATRLDGDIAVKIVHDILSTLDLLIDPRDGDIPERCPECGSYRIKPFWTRDDESGDDLVHLIACAACGWNREVERSAFPLGESEPVREDDVEGDCTPSSGLGPGVSDPKYRV